MRWPRANASNTLAPAASASALLSVVTASRSSGGLWPRRRSARFSGSNASSTAFESPALRACASAACASSTASAWRRGSLARNAASRADSRARATTASAGCAASASSSTAQQAVSASTTDDCGMAA
jgi:hypothetical protein